MAVSVNTLLRWRTGGYEHLLRLHLVIEDDVESGLDIWVRMRGTGVDARSGRDISMGVFDVCRFEGGKLVELWGVPDRFALLHQAGALPPRPA